MKFKYRIKKNNNNLLRFFMSDTDGRDCFYQFINGKNVLINSFNQEPKNENWDRQQNFFFSNVLLMQQKSASCLSEKHFLYIHRIY